MLGFDSIISFFEFHIAAAYLVLFLMMVVEGETFLIIAGVLSHLGALKFHYVVGVAFIGVLIGDVLWYSLGMLLKREGLPNIFLRMINTAERIVDKLLPNFKTKPINSLILAKFIYGTNHATLILAGLMKMNFWLFMKAEIIASVIWVLTFSTLGYFFGYAAIQLSHKVSVFLLLVLLFIVGFISIQRYISFYYENKSKEDNI
ncbi:MAG: DedA family protein [Patescibacteria group bacterium]